jgi:hypothetical protein
LRLQLSAAVKANDRVGHGPSSSVSPGVGGRPVFDCHAGVRISGGLSGIPAGSKACASVVRRRCRRHLPCLPCHSAMLETR